MRDKTALLMNGKPAIECGMVCAIYTGLFWFYQEVAYARSGED